jgi:hypothetical protein
VCVSASFVYLKWCGLASTDQREAVFVL